MMMMIVLTESSLNVELFNSNYVVDRRYDKAVSRKIKSNRVCQFES